MSNEDEKIQEAKETDETQEAQKITSFTRALYHDKNKWPRGDCLMEVTESCAESSRDSAFGSNPECYNYLWISQVK